jgi:hypothetical protein
MDIFKNPPEFTLEGQRDVKSVCGGLMCFVLLILVLVVSTHFMQLYVDGRDFTVSQRRFIDTDKDIVDYLDTFGEIYPGIKLTTGQNFKFAVSFNQKDAYIAQDVTQFI